MKKRFISSFFQKKNLNHLSFPLLTLILHRKTCLNKGFLVISHHQHNSSFSNEPLKGVSSQKIQVFEDTILFF